MVNSRDKGARFERQVAAMFREYGFDSHRTAQHCGNTGQAADIDGTPLLHVECKHQERIQIYDWMDQAKRDSAVRNDRFGCDDIPAVVFKKNNCEVLVCLRFDDFMNLYREKVNSDA